MRNSSVVFAAVGAAIVVAVVVNRSRHRDPPHAPITFAPTPAAEAPDPAGALKITTTDGGVDLVLAGDSVLYMRLSDKVMSQVRQGMDEKTPKDSGLGASIANMVTSSVAKGLASARVSYPISGIDAARYENGAIAFTYRDKHKLSFEGFKSNHRPALESFAPADAERFVAAVNAATRKGSR
ncbi:MAG: hypothetical protein ABJD07_10670 [Gemmatimonadaceae bacterium]